MDPNTEQILILAAAFVAVPVLLSIWRRREGLLHRIRAIVLIEGAYLGVTYLLVRAMQPEPTPLLCGAIAGLVVALRIRPRKRYVRAEVKRRVIARYELKTGKKYNSRTHEIDHDVPFSRGGSHTEDNLRVIEKKKNRSKGAKAPWWDLLG